MKQRVSFYYYICDLKIWIILKAITQKEDMKSSAKIKCALYLDTKIIF